MDVIFKCSRLRVCLLGRTPPPYWFPCSETHTSSSCPTVPGRCAVKNSSPVPPHCLYPWAKPPRRGKPSPFQPQIPRSTTAAAAASSMKATQRLMALCSPPPWTSPTWDNAPSPQPPLLLLWMDTGVSGWKYGFPHKLAVTRRQNLDVFWACFNFIASCRIYHLTLHK